MAVLGTLTAAPTAGYAIPRPRLIGHSLSWWSGLSIVSGGQASLYSQTVFPHVQMYVKYKDWVFEWSKKTVQIIDCVEDAWAIFLPDPTPQGFGSATMVMTWNNYARGWILNFNLPSAPQVAWVQQFPAVNQPYWNPPHPAPVTYPFFIP